MVRGSSEIWQFFYRGEKQNKSHYKAHCLGCIHHYAPNHIKSQPNIDITTLNGEAWFTQACTQAGSVRGVEESMIAHLVGGDKPCDYASANAKKLAEKLRTRAKGKGKEKRKKLMSDKEGEKEDETEGGPSRKRAAIFSNIEMKQTTLKVFKGIRVPFSNEEEKMVQQQFLKASISANLPFHWTENPEVIKLFLMFRSTAVDVIPSAKQLSTTLLEKEDNRVVKEIKEVVKKKPVILTCDGVKDVTRKSLTGVNISCDFKPYLIDLYNSSPDKKDGNAMADSFDRMIDYAEGEFGCTVVGLGTDDDGGSKAGRRLILARRPWIFTFPCTGHQGNLLLCDYFKEYQEADEMALQATELIGWLNNHSRVKVIFDAVQKDLTGTVRAYLVANTTRWTTHFVALKRMLDLKTSLRTAALSRREDIIAAQVGAAQGKKAQEFRAHASKMLDILDESEFWKCLARVVEDIEPIAYVTNICQSDHARPDIVLLAFVGIFNHFRNHSSSMLATAMTKHLERRWKGFNQEMMVAALILNPFERLQSFGPDANINAWTLNVLVTDLFRKYINRPIPESFSEEEHDSMEDKRQKSIQAVSSAFTQYLSETGPFEHWPEQRADFESLHGQDPILWWKQNMLDSRVVDLAHFAVTLLSIVLNTAGNERKFSTLKIQKTRLRNRLNDAKLPKMIRIDSNLTEQQYSDGLRKERKSRSNHDEQRLSELLAVPKYAEILEGDEDEVVRGIPRKSNLVRSRKQWRQEFQGWKDSVQGYDTDNDSDDADILAPNTSRKQKWLPRSLKLLFGAEQSEQEGDDSPRRRHCRTLWTEEALRMELLAQEEGDEMLDDGAKEGSEDEYQDN